MNQTAQITFNADMSLKDSALAKARAQGVTLKAVLTMAMQSYVSGAMQLGLSMQPTYDTLFAESDIIEATNNLGNVLESKEL